MLITVQLFSLSLVRFSGMAIVLLSLGACAKTSSQPLLQPRLEPLPQDQYIQVYFNQSEASVYTEPYRQQMRFGDNLEQIIIDTINQASSSIDVAVQEFRLPKLAQALVERQQAGVKIRVILENNYSRPWSEWTSAEIEQLPELEKNRYTEFVQLVDLNQDGKLSSEEIQQRDALIILKKANIPIINDTEDGSKGTGLMHHKFLVVDGKTVIVTSANFTTSDVHGDLQNLESRGNANNLLKIESSKLARLFLQEFNVMWGDGVGKTKNSLFGVKKAFQGNQQVFINKIPVTIQFSPTSQKQPWEKSSNGLIHQALTQATQSVNLALFVFSEQKLVNSLETVHQRGGTIQALIDPSFAYRSYSEGLDMMGVSLVDKCTYEAGNNPWKKPLSTVGIPNLATSDRLHHKFGIIDNKIVITGSHNWTEVANTGNDETLLIVENSTIAAHFNREFDRLYQNSALGVPRWFLTKAEKDLKACGGSVVTKVDLAEPNLTVKINLNTATQQELETLPGVGEKLAQRIILARQQKRFTSWEDLDRISGVGPKLLEKWRDRVVW